MKMLKSKVDTYCYRDEIRKLAIDSLCSFSNFVITAFGILNNISVWNNSALLHHYYSIFNRIKRMICIFEMRATIDTYIVADPAILIYNAISDVAAIADATKRTSSSMIDRAILLDH